MRKMAARRAMYTFTRKGCHKGFYNDSNPIESLRSIDYYNFMGLPDDEDNPYSSACELLCGSCDRFAIALNKVLGYNPYIVESVEEPHFHAFCQVYKDRRLYYVDARGITSSFDEFMEIAGRFASGEFIIRPVTSIDIEQWENDGYYVDEGNAFAEALIHRYKECYTL